MAGKKKDIAANAPKWEDVPEIPKEEQPYPLPEGWKWVYLKYGYDITSSKRIHKADWRTEGIPFYRTRELVKLSEHGFVDNDLFIEDKLYNEIKELFGVPKINDILISGVGTIGIPWVVENENKFYFKDGNVIWLKSKNKILPKFIFYLFKSEFIKNSLKEMSSGTTVDTYTIVNAKKTKIPLPPLETQRRIVSRIESLFSKLNEAAEKVQAVIDSHEARKQAILHKAFSGELTKKWREENGISLDSWEEKNLIDICAIKSGTTIDKSEELEFGEIPYIKVADMNLPENYIEIKTSSRFVNKINSHNLLPKNCIIFPKRGGAIFTNKKRLVREREILADLNIMAIIPNKNKIALMFLYYWFLTIDLSTLNNGTNVPQINNKDLLPILIFIPTKYEQNIIINIIERLFIKEDKIIKKALFVNNQINIIKHYLLNNIFKGKINLSMG